MFKTVEKALGPHCIVIGNGYITLKTSDAMCYNGINNVCILFQVFCPVSYMDTMKQKDFTLAGYVHLKTSYSSV